nr:hypothetical protein Itr_chr02CG12040 [Ipomoea trifida]GMC66540.1 hypothetical protein Iba_chr02eCG6680 [Ipomoea batatas]
MNQSYGFTSKSSGLSAGSARIDSKRRDVTKAGPKRGIADGISVRRRRPPSVELRRLGINVLDLEKEEAMHTDR